MPSSPWTQEVSKAYAAATTLQAKIQKKVEYAFLKPRSYSGDLKIKGGSLRLELKGPSHTITFLRDGYFLLVTYPPPEEKDGKVKLLSAILDRDAEVFHLLTSLLRGQGLEERFLVEKMEKKEGFSFYQLKPLNKKSELAKVMLKISSEKSLIEEFSYWDQLDNKVTYQFEDVKFGKPVKDKVFEFVAPDDAIRTTL